MRYLKPILALSGVSVLGYAFYNYYQEQKALLAKSDFEVGSVKLTGIDWETRQVGLSIKTKVINNSGIDIVLNSLYMDVYFNDTLIGFVQDFDKTIIPRATTIDLELESAFDISAIVGNVLDLIKGFDFSDINVSFLGQADVSASFINLKIPIENTMPLSLN